MNYPETLYLDDITGCLGQWLDWNTSNVPNEVVAKLQEAYDLAVEAQGH